MRTAAGPLPTLSWGVAMTSPLDHFTKRCEREPGFLGHALARLCDARVWSDADLCEALCCTRGQLATLKRRGLHRPSSPPSSGRAPTGSAA
jgi:hypothetical protein